MSAALIFDRSLQRLVACVMFACLPVLACADEARDLLRRMNAALAERNYDGTFTHLRGNVAENLRIVHRYKNGRTSERLVSLDGSGRDFIRHGNELVCYLPDQQTVLFERRAQARGLLESVPAPDETTEAFYQTPEVESVRLLGRRARLVSLMPRDGFRYGYRVWIDDRTYMPLKTELCDERGRVLERMTFTNLKLLREIPDSAFEPSVDATGFKQARHEPHAEHDGVLASNAQAAGWVARQLPPGFKLTQRGSQAFPGSGGPVSHLVFSDGIASVSVFIGGRGAPAALPPTSEAQVGAASAFAKDVEGHPVTVVGEVPARTVRFIGSGVGRAAGGPSGGH
jgi:sigma-E factor negative regulatory protein RseB